MGFASTYLESRVLYPELISEAPDKETGIIIVVPAYNEPEICLLLESLMLCLIPECSVEVIIVVNAPADASEESLVNNRLTLHNIESWKKANPNCFFRLFAFEASPVIDGWGVGLARKTGMDEAVRRFNRIDKPAGVILNLDADCVVEKNYLLSVYNELMLKKERSACSVYFEHPLHGVEFPENVYLSIVLYELHLRYYFQSLSYTGFPFVFHTVGSTIAVKAVAYVKAGGMNRRQAGEDFYFIQKLVPAGGYFSLNSTAVHPSPRHSFRVPFGTGASIGKLSATENPVLFTYCFEAFEELRRFFKLTDSIYSVRTREIGKLYAELPDGIRAFIDEKEWTEKITEIRNNTSGPESFRKRFFGWFNMFKVVKYLNSVHRGKFEKVRVENAASKLMKQMKHEVNENDPLGLLLFYRSLEKRF